MNTDKLLEMLLDAIDYSFLQIDNSYDKTLTYPVIDKIQYIKEQLKNNEPVSEDLKKFAEEWDESLYRSDAVIAGADWKERQMIKDAIEVEVKIDAGGYPYIPIIELYDYDKDVPLAKDGDKVKVILVKED